jgi:parallel beta-helix repeat protein
MDLRRTLVSCLALACLAGAAPAGPIDPPVGPVASTMKPLTDVEPRTAVNATNTPGNSNALFRITAPGSYYLTANVMGTAGKNGIEIAANDVTLDLGGFAVLGVTAASGSGVVSTLANQVGLTVRNGTIRQWGQIGLDLSSVTGAHVSSITTANNSTHGVFVGNNASIEDCISRSNGQAGILTGSGAVLARCVVDGNNGTGNFAAITSGDRCAITACVATNNAGTGIATGHSSRIGECQCGYNAQGILAYYSCIVTSCACTENTSDGIHAGAETTVTGCHCSGNGDDGIEVAGQCVVTHNTCTDNGASAVGAGVYVNGADCHIEDNALRFNRYGVLVNPQQSQNFIVRNTARNNLGGSFSVPANNHLAPVINNPGTTFTGATAWSNFEY